MDRAKSILEKRIMTVSEYEIYRNNSTHWNSLRNNFECPECGDRVMFVPSGTYVAFFKHLPSHYGHNYCSLYTSGKVSNSTESALRKKLLEQANVSLNFELRYVDGRWSSYITIPPFSKEEIDRNTLNATKLNIYNFYGSSEKIQIDFSNEKFSSGEIKKIKLNGIPRETQIRIDGRNCKHIISYTFECFNPNEQIYSYLISQDYTINTNSSSIDLKDVHNLILKKHVGKIYTGRHYVIIYPINSNQMSKLFSLSAVNAKKLIFKDDYYFRYELVDISFNEATEEAKVFCASHGCELVQRDDAVILWPPVVSESQYKYFSIGRKMHIASQSDDRINEIKQFDISNKIYFRVDNVNTDPYYLTKSKKFLKENNIPSAVIENIHGEYIFNGNKAFEFFKGVLVKRVYEKTKLKKNNYIVDYENVLQKRVFSLLTDSKTNMGIILDAMRYGNKHIPFTNRQYKMIVKLNEEIDFVKDYLEVSLERGTIKKEVLDILMEG